MKKIYKILCLMSLILLLGACSLFKKDSTEPTQTVKSTDGIVSLTMPKTWKATELNAVATLEMALPEKEQYLIVIIENRQDFADTFTLDNYTDIIKNNMKNAVAGGSLTEAKDTTIGKDIKAKELYLTGTINNIKAKYLIWTAEDDNHFYQIITWSLLSKFDNAEGVYRDIVKTFKAN